MSASTTSPASGGEEPLESALSRLIAFFEHLTLDQVDQVAAHYSADAWFKDPFNEVRGCEAITRIFRHMFEQVDEPRFVIHERIAQGSAAVLTWDFTFSFKPPLRAGPQTIRGCSHLRFDTSGRVSYHRDYWDAAEELYARLPVLGVLMRWLRRRGALPPA